MAWLINEAMVTLSSQAEASPLLLTRAISRSWRRLAQAVLLTVSQAQLYQRSFRPACGNPQESGGASRKATAVPNLVRFSALPMGLSDEQLEEVAVRRHLHGPHAILAPFSLARFLG